MGPCRLTIRGLNEAATLRSRRLAHDARAENACQRHTDLTAFAFARAEPGRKRPAASAPELALRPRQFQSSSRFLADR